MILLDTSVLISPPARFPDAEVGASIIALAELQFGIHSAPDAVSRASRTRRLALLRSMIDWLPFDEAAAESYGVLAAEVRRTRPSHARSKDVLMAAHALSLGASFMTRNVRDFEPVAHLVDLVPAG